MAFVLLTILDGISETSMPFNEFVLWRANHCPEERQLLLIIGKKIRISMDQLPERLEVIQLGWNPFNIRKAIKSIIQDLNDNGNKYAIHLHQLKSATLAHISMLGTDFRKKTVFTTHSTFTGYALHNKIQSYFNGFMSKYVTCVSNAAYEGYPASLKKWKGSSIITIRNGVDLDRINKVLDGNSAKERDEVKFIYVARLIPLKNHAFLVDVIKDTDKRAHFIFVGKEDNGSVKKLIKGANLEDRITLTGLIPRAEVFKLLNNSDVYTSSSTLEGMPISVLEAMYCKLPAILSDIPQHKEIGGDDCFVSYLPFDRKKWIDEINKYVNMSVDERNNRGIKGRNYIEENFSLNVMHQKYSEIYKKLQQC